MYKNTNYLHIFFTFGDRNTAGLMIVFVLNNYQGVRDHMRRRIDKDDGRYGGKLWKVVIPRQNNSVVCQLPMEEM